MLSGTIEYRRVFNLSTLKEGIDNIFIKHLYLISEQILVLKQN